jgi:hypothetical protein
MRQLQHDFLSELHANAQARGPNLAIRPPIPIERSIGENLAATLGTGGVMGGHECTLIIPHKSLPNQEFLCGSCRKSRVQHVFQGRNATSQGM